MVNPSSDPPPSALATPEPSRGRILTLLALGYSVTGWFDASMTSYRRWFIRQDPDIGLRALVLLFLLRAVSQIIGGIAGGLATDLVRDRKNILLVSLLGLCLFSSIQGFSTTFRVFAVLFCIQGFFGGSLWQPAANAVIGDRFPDRMGFGLGIHPMASAPVAGLGSFAMAALLTWVTWRTAFAFQFLAGAVAVFFFWRLVPRLGDTTRIPRTGSYGHALRSGVFVNLPLIGVTVVAALHSGATSLIRVSLHNHLSATGMSVAGIRTLDTCRSLLTMVCLPVVGHISDRWGRKSTIFISLIASGLLVGSVPLYPSGWLLPPLVSLSAMALFPVGYVILASGLEHTPKEVWGGAQVFMNVAQSLLPVILPVTAGWVGNRYSFDSFFLYLSATIYFVAAAAILMVPEATRYHDGYGVTEARELK